MNHDIQISINHKADIAVINIIGDVTATTKEEIYGAYQSDNVLNSQKILLSFDENCYINGGGIEALIDIAAKGYKKRQKINACGLSNHFQKIFCMVGLANLIFVFPSEEAALNDFTRTNTEDISVMKLKNCWEVMKCGRERNGKNEKLGICPAAESSDFDGVNNGELGGRFCWNFGGTFCKEVIQGTVAKKLQNCLKCAFFNIVSDEEGENFILTQEDAKKKVFL